MNSDDKKKKKKKWPSKEAISAMSAEEALRLASQMVGEKKPNRSKAKKKRQVRGLGTKPYTEKTGKKHTLGTGAKRAIKKKRKKQEEILRI